MEKYVGYRMLFTTPQGTINGVLKEWDAQKEQVKISKNGSDEVFDILDILELEIVNLNEEKNDDFLNEGTVLNIYNVTPDKNRDVFQIDSSNKDIIDINKPYCDKYLEKQTNNSVVEKLNNINIQSEKETLFLPKKNKNKNFSEYNFDKENIVIHGGNKNCETLLNTNNEAEIQSCYNDDIKKNLTKNDENLSTLDYMFINEINYFKLLNECFNIYGPTKEEFINVVSFNLQKLIKKYKSGNICISLGKNSLYNCIGYHLGRILIVKSYNVFIEDNEDNNIEVLKYKFTFLNNKNESNLNNLSNFSLCISFGSTKIQSKEYFYINKIFDNFDNSTCISLGCIINYYDKNMYLVDVNISDELYKKFNLKRVFLDSAIMKIK